MYSQMEIHTVVKASQSKKKFKTFFLMEAIKRSFSSFPKNMSIYNASEHKMLISML